VEPSGARRHGAHRPHRPPPHQSGGGLGGHAGAELPGEPRARRLQDGGRRPDLDEGPLCGREDRRGRLGRRFPQSRQALRRHVGAPPLAVVFPLRGPGLRALRLARRGEDLGAAHGGGRPPRGGARAHQARRLPLQPRGGLRHGGGEGERAAALGRRRRQLPRGSIRPRAVA
jgi:hypothetical protein